RGARPGGPRAMPPPATATRAEARRRAECLIPARRSAGARHGLIRISLVTNCAWSSRLLRFARNDSFLSSLRGAQRRSNLAVSGVATAVVEINNAVRVQPAEQRCARRPGDHVAAGARGRGARLR